MAKMLRDRIPAFIAMGVVALLVGIDRLTKMWIVNNVEYSTSIPGIRLGDFKLIDITHIHNTGAALGSLQGQQTLLIIVTSIFIAAAIVFMFSGKIRLKMMMAAITLIVGGGIGNLIDRITLRYVIDFIELKFINFAVFNFADMCVVAGSCLLFLVVVSEEIREYKAKRACAVEEDDTIDDDNESNEA